MKKNLSSQLKQLCDDSRAFYFFKQEHEGVSYIDIGDFDNLTRITFFLFGYYFNAPKIPFLKWLPRFYCRATTSKEFHFESKWIGQKIYTLDNLPLIPYYLILMKLEQRIAKEIARKTSRLVRITSRTRNAKGFDVVRPDGTIYHTSSKKEALSHLLVQIKIANYPKFKLINCK